MNCNHSLTMEDIREYRMFNLVHVWRYRRFKKDLIHSPSRRYANNHHGPKSVVKWVLKHFFTFTAVTILLTPLIRAYEIDSSVVKYVNQNEQDNNIRFAKKVYSQSYLSINYHSYSKPPTITFITQPKKITDCQNLKSCILVPLRPKSERRKRHTKGWELIEPKLRPGHKNGRKNTNKNSTSSLGRLKVFKYVTEDNILNAQGKSSNQPVASQLVASKTLFPLTKHGNNNKSHLEHKNKDSSKLNFLNTNDSFALTERPRRSPFPKAQALVGGPSMFHMSPRILQNSNPYRYNSMRKVVVPTHYVGMKPMFITQPAIKSHHPQHKKILPKSTHNSNRKYVRMPTQMNANNNLQIMKPPEVQLGSPSIVHYHHEPPPSLTYMDTSLEKEGSFRHPFIKRWNRKLRSQMARLRNRRRNGYGNVHSRTPEYLSTPTKDDFDRIRRRRKPSYNYPRNAQNIQDILSHFEKSPNQRHRGSIYKQSGLGDFSAELRDVQGSLLKDIREFSRRPQIWDEEDQPPRRVTSRPKSSHVTTEDPYDTIFDPKPKPVRDMIKSSSKFPHYDDDRHREDDDRHRFSQEDNDRRRHRPRDSYEHRYHREEKDPYYYDRSKEHGYHRDEDRPHYHRNKNEHVPPYHRDKYHGGPQNSPEYQSKESQYPPYPSSKPIIIKHPYQQQTYSNNDWVRNPSYENDGKNWKKKHNNNVKHGHDGSSSTKPSIVSMPQLPTHAQGTQFHFPTGISNLESSGVFPTEAAKKEMERKALEKLYMDLLRQKAIAEAALLKPTSVEKPVATTTQKTVRKKPPMRMKIHIYPNNDGGNNNGHDEADHQNNKYSSRDNEHSYSHHSNNNNPAHYNPPHSVNHRLGGFASHHDHHPHQSSVHEADGKKNFVLHLHVHRRNGGPPFEMETDASQIASSTMAPQYTYR